MYRGSKKMDFLIKNLETLFPKISVEGPIYQLSKEI
jgi:hypothetical protein